MATFSCSSLSLGKYFFNRSFLDESNYSLSSQFPNSGHELFQGGDETLPGHRTVPQKKAAGFKGLLMELMLGIWGTSSFER